MELNSNQVFGDGFTQNEDFLIIRKKDLGLLGRNSPTQILAALLLFISNNIRGFVSTPDNGFLLDESAERINYDNSGIYLSDLFLWRVILSDGIYQHIFFTKFTEIK